MIRRFILGTVGCLFLISVACRAQTPVEVLPCDLVARPEMYDNKLIQIRDSVWIGFENFTLHTESCGERLRSIWLDYGRQDATPRKLAFNDRDRRPGTLKEINGKPIVLMRDDSSKLFSRRLNAVSIGRPSGETCFGDGCHLYSVTATFTGYFFAAKKGGGGYGHLGCCHLFVIQQVADVDAQRTNVPIGGNFAPDSVIGCTDLGSSFTVSKPEAKGIAHAAGPNHEVWRFAGEQEASRAALDEAARRWGVQLIPEMKFGGCRDRMVVGGNQFMWCDWSDADSTQSFSIQVTRFGFLRNLRDWSKVPWILSGGYGIACSIEDK